MNRDRNPSPVPPTGAVNNERRQGRIRCPAAACELGAIVDLSASGMRVLYEGPGNPVRVGETRSLTVTAGTEALAVQAVVIWVRPGSATTCEIGLAFRGLGPDQRAVLFRVGTHRPAGNDHESRDAA